ncbi:MAG: hypothetical protein PHU47_02725 [Candidatus ainarchaeum sp.]|nr:hypothetical protein [Candidatus ainarchaeum sp.]
MARALVTAQVQSVKEINKKAEIKKWNRKITTIVLVVLILSICAIFVYNFFQGKNFQRIKYDFSESELGVTFYSNEFSIADSLNIIKQDKNITLVFTIDEKDINNLSDFSESISLFMYLFSANDKKVTQIVNVSNKNSILYCSTNYGDIYSNEDISAQECLSLINSADTLIVLKYPQSTLNESAIYLNASEKNVLITPKSLEDLSISTYLLLKSMYPNMEKTLESIYKIRESLTDETSLIKSIDQNVADQIDQNTVTDSNLE